MYLIFFFFFNSISPVLIGQKKKTQNIPFDYVLMFKTHLFNCSLLIAVPYPALSIHMHPQRPHKQPCAGLLNTNIENPEKNKTLPLYLAMLVVTGCKCSLESFPSCGRFHIIKDFCQLQLVSHPNSRLPHFNHITSSPRSL